MVMIIDQYWIALVPFWREVVETRLGVDVGGPFSDLVMYDEEAGRIAAAKGLSTPAGPELGVLAVVADTASHE
jgi:N-methylhydantoinase A/oxoprolinase/acetone carboxylase beta subunit